MRLDACAPFGFGSVSPLPIRVDQFQLNGNRRVVRYEVYISIKWKLVCRTVRNMHFNSIETCKSYGTAYAFQLN